MSKEPKKPRGASSHRDWGIVARFADGSHAYYYIDGRYRESDSRPPERWGRESQASRFPSEAEARRRAQGMQVNSAVKAYDVEQLAPVRHKNTASAPSTGSPTQRSG